MTKQLSDLEHYDKIRNGWLLDTNIISVTIGSNTVPEGVRHFFDTVSDERLRISVITLGEMRKGVELVDFDHALFADPDALRISRHWVLAKKLAELERDWADRILPVDAAVANKWGELLALQEKQGEPVPAIDALIAATARVHDLAVASHDASFQRMREYVSVYDPWSYDSSKT